MGGGQTYRIKTVEDFLNIPPEKLEACIVDFLIWCRHAKTFDDLIKTSTFVWIDDGEHHISIVNPLTDEIIFTTREE